MQRPTLALVRRLILVVLVVLAASCDRFGSSPPTTFTTAAPAPALGAATPRRAAQDWVTQLGDEDFQSTQQVVLDRQIALLAGLEGMSVEQVAGMLDEVPGEIRQNFWRAFAESFPTFAGERVDDLVVGDIDQFGIGEDRFAAVQIVFRERLGSGEVLVKRGAEGRWFVDLLATFGHAFAQPLLGWLDDVPHEGDGAEVRRALAEFRSSLEAALEREPLGELTNVTRSDLQLLMAQLG